MYIDKIKQIVCKQLKLDESELDENTSLIDDIGIDSIDLMGIISSLEMEFNIEVDLEQIKNIHTIKEISNYIESKK